MPYRPLMAPPNSGVMGVVYLLHLDAPLHPTQRAQHYTGWARVLEARDSHHRDGTGARFTQVAVQRGIGWVIAKVEPGDKNRERQLKNQGGAKRRCPICIAQRRANEKVQGRVRAESGRQAG